MCVPENRQNYQLWERIGNEHPIFPTALCWPGLHAGNTAPPHFSKVAGCFKESFSHVSSSLATSWRLSSKYSGKLICWQHLIRKYCILKLDWRISLTFFNCWMKSTWRRKGKIQTWLLARIISQLSSPKCNSSKIVWNLGILWCFRMSKRLSLTTGYLTILNRR